MQSNAVEAASTLPFVRYFDITKNDNVVTDSHDLVICELVKWEFDELPPAVLTAFTTEQTEPDKNAPPVLPSLTREQIKDWKKRFPVLEWVRESPAYLHWVDCEGSRTNLMTRKRGDFLHFPPLKSPHFVVDLPSQHNFCNSPAPFSLPLAGRHRVTGLSTEGITLHIAGGESAFTLFLPARPSLQQQQQAMLDRLASCSDFDSRSGDSLRFNPERAAECLNYHFNFGGATPAAFLGFVREIVADESLFPSGYLHQLRKFLKEWWNAENTGLMEFDLLSAEPHSSNTQAPAEAEAQNGEVNTFAELFHDPAQLKLCMNALYATNPPLLSDTGHWIGKQGSKSALVAWISVLEQRGKLKQIPNRRTLSTLLNQHFPGLNLEKTASILGKEAHKRTDFEAVFLRLIPG